MKQHYVGERHRVLLEINNAIITSLSRESLFKAIGQALVDVLPFDRLSLTVAQAVARAIGLSNSQCDLFTKASGEEPIA